MARFSFKIAKLKKEEKSHKLEERLKPKKKNLRQIKLIFCESQTMMVFKIPGAQTEAIFKINRRSEIEQSKMDETCSIESGSSSIPKLKLINNFQKQLN